MSNLQLDGNKLLHHLDRVNAWTRGELINPIYIAFSPTSYCNHHCVFCVYHYKEFSPIFFPLKRYQELCAEWASLGIRSIFFAGDGEPLLNKHCHEMVAATKLAGIDVALNTNGRLLNEKNISVFVENLSFIRLSVNAGSPEVYAKIHGTNENDFEIVMSNIKLLVEKKKEMNSDITIGVQCVLLSQNKEEIKTLAHRVKEIGVDYLAIKPFLKHPKIKFNDTIENLPSILDELESFGKKISDDGPDSKFRFVLRSTLFLNKFERKYKSCQSTDFMIEIDAKGDVYSCGPYVGITEHKLGNIIESSFREFWGSEMASRVRGFVRCQVDVSTCMPFCRPDSINEVLWQIKNPPQHINYI